ncbi:nuclear poly(A) polymerase 1 [Gracilaria domingensis]|nr:nuclear poly(A) polymerase 1 [Gracilaria domingensis]
MNLADSIKIPGVAPAMKTMNGCNIRNFLDRHQKSLTNEERARRTFVVSSLDSVAQRWVRNVAHLFHIQLPERVEQLSRVFSFGSHALGVDGPGSDVDIVVITPIFVSRKQHFFGPQNRANCRAKGEEYSGTCMLDLLYRTGQAEQIVDLRDAYAPVIRFLFHGVNVDMQCAPLAVSYIPFPLDVLDNSLLKDVDPGTSRSASGVRSDQAMIRGVPNYDTFCSVLRMVKLWAKRRCIYSSLHGYLGGISWAILTARICQTYEGYSEIRLLALFFKTYAAWEWAPFPLWRPVRMTFEKYDGMWRNWDNWMPPSTYYQNPMQIICPVVPFTNTSYNVCRTTHNAIMKEIRRACRIMEEVTRASLSIDAGLLRLVEMYPFDHCFPLYLVIEVKAKDPTNYREWQNFVESRIRRLTYELEQTCGLEDIRPFPEAVKSVCHQTSEKTSSFFVGLGTSASVGNIPRPSSVLDPSIKRAISSWECMMNSWKFKKPGMSLIVRLSTGIRGPLEGSTEQNATGSGRKRKREDYEAAGDYDMVLSSRK